MSGRTNLPEAVTDVLVERGERRVIRKLASNSSARFSEAGYSGMLTHAEADDELTEVLGLRIDLPLKFLRDLLQQGPRKFADFETSLVGASPSTLSDRLKKLTAAGVLEQKFYSMHPPRAEYVLTRKGRELGPIVRTMREWGARHT